MSTRGKRPRGADSRGAVDSQPQSKMPKRVRNACLQCRKTRQRCDNQRPCLRCIDAGKDADCIQDDAEDDDTAVVPLMVVDFSTALMRFIKDYSAHDIHDMIVSSPLKWMAFLGVIVRWTNKETLQKVQKKLIQQAISVADEVSLPILNEVRPLQETHFHEIEFKKISKEERPFSEQEVEDICYMFNVMDLYRSDIAIVKVAFFPHKNGPRAAKVVYHWNEAMAELIEADYETFHEVTSEKWVQITSNSTKGNDAGRVPPAFWNLFTSRSYERHLEFILDVMIKKQRLVRVEQLDVQTLKSSSNVSCCVRWHATLYPLLDIPSSFTISLRPITNSWNPFTNHKQKRF
jgi:hypothetical protein